MKHYYNKVCVWCGKEFTTIYENKKYCSEHCAKRCVRLRYMTKRKYYINNNGNKQRIGIIGTYRRFDGICQICGRKCDWNDYERVNDKWFKFGKTYPTIDHIIPLSQGGQHSLANTQLACMECNCKNKREHIINVSKRELNADKVLHL